MQVLHSEKADAGPSEGSVLLRSSGAALDADLVVWTVGSRPNTEFLRSTPLAAALDEAGRVKVRVCTQLMVAMGVAALGGGGG